MKSSTHTVPFQTVTSLSWPNKRNEPGWHDLFAKLHVESVALGISELMPSLAPANLLSHFPMMKIIK